MSLIQLPRPESFTSRLRSPAVAARIGVWLAITFGACFLTGLFSHYAQLDDPTWGYPTSPAWGYRLTQGVHVVSGIAAIPLLLVKLWVVFPRLFERPPLRPPSRVLLTGLERGSIAVLVGSSIFQLATGAANAAQWYPWSTFSFRTTHYAVAWVAIGALVVHIAVKLPVIRDAFGSDVDSGHLDREGVRSDSVVSRRALIGGTLAASGLAALATAGGTVSWLRQVSVFAVRSGEGPQGVPINRTAAAAGVTESAADPAYRLWVRVDGEEVASFDLAALSALEQHTEELPIACVEGWSATGSWTGVRISDLLREAGVTERRDVRVSSLQQGGAFSTSELPAEVAADPRTLLALALADEPLSLDHGYPARLIAPNRPGVLQTKWVTGLEVST